MIIFLIKLPGFATNADAKGQGRSFAGGCLLVVTRAQRKRFLRKNIQDSLLDVPKRKECWDLVQIVRDQNKSRESFNPGAAQASVISLLTNGNYNNNDQLSF